MTDLFARTQAEFVRQQGGFLNQELASCARAADLASTMSRGRDRKSIERSIREAEQGYSELVRLLSDPSQAKRLTIKTKQELTQKMKALRLRLDELRRMK